MVILESVFLVSLIFVANVQAFPKSLSITVKNDNEIFTLNWKYTQQYLANKNLPVWYAWKGQPPVLQPHVMNDIGPFAMYHDVEKSSAVVYFKKIDCLFGIIDTRFVIYNLPLSELQSGRHQIVNGPYIKRRAGRNHDDIMNFIFDGISSSSSTRSPHSSNDIPKTHNHIDRKHHSEFDILYPEILVLVPNDMVRKYKTAMALVAFYLVQMNAIDMLFAKLAADGVFIHINIAGFVLEGTPDVFPHIYSSEPSELSNVLDGVTTLKVFPKYLEQYDDIFVEDSYDFFLLFTQHHIKFGARHVGGLARSDTNVYELRSSSNGLMTNYDSAGALIQDQPDHGNFAVAAHELAHLMGVGHDPIDSGKLCFDIQCYGILQSTASHCKNCIVWSAESRRQFQSYVRWDKNHCFLINQSRALHPYGTPIKTLGTHQQCACYGYQSHRSFGHELGKVNQYSCKKKLTCADDNLRIHHRNPKPVDGTLCGKNKVCWNRTCRKLMNTEKKKCNFQIIPF